MDNAADYLIFNMQKHGAYLLKDQVKIDELEALRHNKRQERQPGLHRKGCGIYPVKDRDLSGKNR